MSPDVVPGGATPIIVNKTKPKGGLIPSISTQTTSNIQNHTGLMPEAMTIGIKRGTMANSRARIPINVPRMFRATSIIMMSTIGGTGKLSIILLAISTAPE